MDAATDAPRGADASSLRRLGDEVRAHPERRHARFVVATTWKGGVRSDSRIGLREIAGRRIEADFTLRVDEPEALGGGDTAPSPHELLLAALNACLVAGYAAAFARAGVLLRSLVVTTRSELDLGGALGVAPDCTPACQRVSSTVRIRADAAPDVLQSIHHDVVRRSPNGWCLSQPLTLETELVLE